MLCRSQGYKCSVSTLNRLIAEERKEYSANTVTLSLRKKIIHIIWDFEKVNHEEEMNAIHPQLFEEFPALLELDQLVGSFRTLLHAKASDGLRKWLVAYKDSKFQYIDSFLNGIKEDQRAVWHSIVLPW